MAKDSPDIHSAITDVLKPILIGLIPVMVIVNLLAFFGVDVDEEGKTFVLAVFEVLEKWQTLLAAVFGVVGLIAAHILNARHQRERDAETREKDAAALSAALCAEVYVMGDRARQYSRIMKYQLDEARSDGEEVIAVDVKEMKHWKLVSDNSIFSANLNRLDTIHGDAVNVLIRFHLQAEDFQRNLREGGADDEKIMVMDTYKDEAIILAHLLEHIHQSDDVPEGEYRTRSITLSERRSKQ